MHLDGFAGHTDRVNVVAVCDPDQSRVAAVREKYGVGEGYSSLVEMIESSDWDAAIVCTPTSVRENVVAELAAAGKHMLVEKPMASTYQEAERIVARCERAGVRLAVDQNFRYHYPFDLAREQIKAGAIGTVANIVHRDLFFRQDKGWRTAEKRHGLAVMGIHWLDGLRWILDRDAASVYAQMGSSGAIDCAGDTDSTVTVAFPNGAFGTYIQSFSSMIGATETVVIGDKGVLTLDYERLALYDRTRSAEPRATWENRYAGANKPESSFACLERLLASIETGAEPPNSGRDNLKTVALLEAAYRSAETAAPVRLENGLLS